jgi:5,10-methylenetetrahydromethanopterin reductase
MTRKRLNPVMNVSFGTALPLDQNWGSIQAVPKVAEKLERWGFDCLWCPDERFGRNVYSVLSLAATSTTSIKLGVSVTNPYTRHPLITAAAIATVNEVSGGRAILGLGAGASTFFERHGMQRPHPPLTMMRESIEVLRPFLDGGNVNYEGRTLKFKGVDIDFESKPVPIYVAARGPKLFQLAGEIADGVIIGSLASKEGLDFAFDNIKIGAERSGRDLSELDIVFWAYTAIAKDEEAAINLVKRIVVSSMWSSRSIVKDLGISDEWWRPVDETLRKGFRKGLKASDVYASASSMLPDEVFQSWSVAGTLDTVIAKVKAILERGVNQFAVLPLGGSLDNSLTMQKRFAESIIPLFR